MTRLVKTEPLASMLHPGGDDDPILDHRFEELDDAAVEAEIRRKVETIYHPTSTARMAPKEDGGVVDPFLRVHGIPNLRIVDASILPNITSGPTVRRTIAANRWCGDGQRVLTICVCLVTTGRAGHCGGGERRGHY